MLTNTLIKNVKQKEKPYKIADEKGMYLLVNTNGSKLLGLTIVYTESKKLLL